MIFKYVNESAIQPCWPGTKKSDQSSSIEKNSKNFTIRDCIGVVGLDSSGNDYIRNGTDKNFYWFHLDNFTGAHCILKIEDISKISMIELKALASMLRDLSHLEILEIPMIFTQLKNVKGVKGQAGKVIVKKAKHLRFEYTNWKEIISI